MGHYDDAYDYEYARQRERHQQALAKRYTEIKPHLDELERFVANFGDKTLIRSAFESFEAALVYQLKQENVLILNPEILLNKLEK